MYASGWKIKTCNLYRDVGPMLSRFGETFLWFNLPFCQLGVTEETNII